LRKLTIHRHRPMTMTDVDRLLQTYIERFESGGSVDPTDLLDQAEGKERARLSALIDGYLEHAAPAQQWDAKGFEGSVTQRAVEMLQESWAEESSALPAQLVALRKQAELKRSSLVESLAKALGATKKPQREKVATYYNAMEHGQLDPRGVSSRVFDALAGILGTTADTLRRAGESVAPSAGGEPGGAFARMTRIEATDEARAVPAPKQTDPDAIETEDWDEVDRLFRGGDDG
jgi:hypothetical protein